MVTITCNNQECSEFGVDSNFGENPEFVECGGCHCMLKPRDYRDDPQPPVYPLGEITE